MASGRPTGGKKSASVIASASPAAAPATVEAPGATSGGERGLGALGYWGPLVIIPVIMRKKSRFLAFHTRQALYLFGTAVATVLVTLGLLFLFDQTSGRDSPPFLFFSVVLLLEIVVYSILVVALTVQALRSKMTMLPLLGDLAGEG